MENEEKAPKAKKSFPAWGKALIGLALIGVIVLAIYLPSVGTKGMIKRDIAERETEKSDVKEEMPEYTCHEKCEKEFLAEGKEDLEKIKAECDEICQEDEEKVEREEKEEEPSETTDLDKCIEECSDSYIRENEEWDEKGKIYCEEKCDDYSKTEEVGLEADSTENTEDAVEIPPLDLVFDYTEIEIQERKNFQPNSAYGYVDPELSESKTTILFSPEPYLFADWLFDNFQMIGVKDINDVGYFTHNDGVLSTNDDTGIFRVIYPNFDTADNADVTITTEDGVYSKKVIPEYLEIPPVDITCDFEDETGDFVCDTGLNVGDTFPNVTNIGLICQIVSGGGSLMKNAESSDMSGCNLGEIGYNYFYVKAFLKIDFSYEDDDYFYVSIKLTEQITDND